MLFVDCEQSARAREHRGDERNEGGSLSRLAPSVTRVVICVSWALRSTDHEDPQATFFCDQHDFLVATDALFSKGDKRISCCGNLISTLISGQKT